MNQERKAVRAIAIKAILKEYGLKGTLSVRHHSTLVLNIKSGAIDFIGNVTEQAVNRNAKVNEDAQYLGVNPYWYKEQFTGKALECVDKIVKAMNGADYYDNSDVQSDYFDTSHYIDINIGNWNAPYQLTK
jgi:hypothetical protein